MCVRSFIHCNAAVDSYCSFGEMGKHSQRPSKREKERIEELRMRMREKERESDTQREREREVCREMANNVLDCQSQGRERHHNGARV